MKHLFSIVAVFILLLPLSSSCQVKMLGQTKQYIIKTHAECYIAINTDNTLKLECDNNIYFYNFSESTHLCIKSGTMDNLTSLPNFSKWLTDGGFTLYPNAEEYSNVPDVLKVYCNGEIGCFIFSFNDSTFVASFKNIPNCQ